MVTTPLVTNYSNYPLTNNQKEFLNRGLNFSRCRNLNKTDVVVSLLVWQRNMLRKEFWWRQKNEDKLIDYIQEIDEENEEDENNNATRLFRDQEQKTNLPKGHRLAQELL